LANSDWFTPSPRVVRAPRWFSIVKDAVDLVLGSILLALASPVVLAAATFVRLTSSGPAFYSQVRVGRGGQTFTLYKLRSMYRDCERLSGPQWSQPGDPRVTPLGRWLRKTHLDELPQLWNVVRGEMSLIGPRPERLSFVAQLEHAIPHYTDRLLIRPGMTGLAQVLLPPDDGFDSVRVKVAHDRLYIAAMGPQLDVKIFLATALKIAGVPFDVTRDLLNLPTVSLTSSPILESAYRHGLLGAIQSAPGRQDLFNDAPV
jgi:lipopolysaccharide/colanic/teichoic acid biosynthesis glycosyltransferase